MAPPLVAALPLPACLCVCLFACLNPFCSAAAAVAWRGRPGHKFQFKHKFPHRRKGQMAFGSCVWVCVWLLVLVVVVGCGGSWGSSDTNTSSGSRGYLMQVFWLLESLKLKRKKGGVVVELLGEPGWF